MSGDDTLARDYEEVHEFDGNEIGSVMGYHLDGHGYHPDDVETFLNDEIQWCGPWGDDFIPFEWEVTERWVRKVPAADTGNYRYAYAHTPGRGAKAVTVIERPYGWGRWCYRHPDEPASTGMNASWFIDGEKHIAERLAEHAQEIDPRTSVDDRHIYYCRPCASDIADQQTAARTAARNAPGEKP